MAGGFTLIVKNCLQRIKEGESNARIELLEHSCQRLRQLASHMLRGYHKLDRWEQTDDVLNQSLLRLHRALKEVVPESPKHYLRLAALQIRRELKDLARKHFGPNGIAAKLNTNIVKNDHANATGNNEVPDQTNHPDQLAMWSDLHEYVELLPDEQREVFEFLWYHQLTQQETADVLEINRRTVIRRWQAACITLHQALFQEE